jgi:hypothetical protein
VVVGTAITFGFLNIMPRGLEEEEAESLSIGSAVELKQVFTELGGATMCIGCGKVFTGLLTRFQ